VGTNDLASFAKDDDDAKRRFEAAAKIDPLPRVAPALLNSADIEEYVKLTGMVFPFEPRPEMKKLKSASYEVDFLGDLHIVDPVNGYQKVVIRADHDYRLPKNSISFLFTRATFRLPDYIAARFNLRITHVHAGLLLGTGPLIDPGFAGRLLIPLHNLTSEDYIIKGGHGVIWVEFTKLSDNVSWKATSDRTGAYQRFDDKKWYMSAEDYFEKAFKGRDSTVPVGAVRPARSSIPGEINDAKQSAKRAEDYVWWLTKVGIGAIVAILVSAGLVTFTIYSLVQDAVKNVGDASNVISDYRDAQNTLERRLSTLEEELKQRREKKELPPAPKNPAAAPAGTKSVP